MIDRRTFCASTVAALTYGCQTSGGPIELRLGSVNSLDSLVGVTATEFARRANAALAGKVNVVVFGSSQLGDDRTMLLKVKLGTVDFVLNSTIMSSEIDAFGYFEMPYLLKDRQHVRRVSEAVFWPSIAPLAEGRQLKVIGLFENGFRQITNNARPIVTPADLSGIKLRTPLGRWRLRLFQSYGASPTPMSMAEVFVALRTGVIDGQENPLVQIWSQKFQEVQRYLSLSNHVYSPAYLTVGSKRWASLPSEISGRLEEIARDMQGWVLDRGQEMDDTLVDELRATGIEINEIDRDAFIEASQQIYSEFSEEVPGGKEWIERALQLADT
jgi:tripartite ATP-independent transporter DctP family solute receptor